MLSVNIFANYFNLQIYNFFSNPPQQIHNKTTSVPKIEIETLSPTSTASKKPARNQQAASKKPQASLECLELRELRELREPRTPREPREPREPRTPRELREPPCPAILRGVTVPKKSAPTKGRFLFLAMHEQLLLNDNYQLSSP